MADLREAFGTLEDAATGAGEALISRIEGEAAAGQNGSIGFAFKDNSGNVILPTLTADGRLPVSQNAAGTCLSGNDKVVGSATEVQVLEISLAAGETYKELDITVSCFRDAIFRIAHVNDPAGTPTETDLGEVLVGPGSFTQHLNHKCMEFVAGATDPVLRIYGQNLNSLSDMRAIASLLQVA